MLYRMPKNWIICMIHIGIGQQLKPCCSAILASKIIRRIEVAPIKQSKKFSEFEVLNNLETDTPDGHMLGHS